MYFEYAQELERNGFLVIPMKYHNKDSIYPKYAHLNRDSFPTKAEKQEWLIKFGDDSNIVFLGDVTPALDFDIENEEIAEAMKEFIISKFDHKNKNLFFRYGSRPKFLVPFTRRGEYKKLHTAKYTNDRNESCQIEVMGTKSSYTYYGTHRKTGKPYTEEHKANKKLKDVKLNSLPNLSKKDIIEIFEKFEELITNSNDWTKSQASSKISHNAEFNAPEDKDPSLYTDEEIKDMLMDIPYLGYNEWVYIGMALHHKYDGKSKGEGYWLEYSKKQCPELFDKTEVEYKWLSFSSDSDDHITISYITNLYFSLFGADASDDTLHLCKSIPEAVDRFYQIANTSEIYDSSLAGLSGSEGINITSVVPKKAFLDTHSHILIDREVIKNGKATTISKSVAEWWCVQPARKTVQGVVFNPKKDKLYYASVGDKKALFGNTFVSQSFPLTSNDNLVSYLTDHLEYLIPKENERTWFLQWMAWIIRHKGERCKVAPLLINTEHGSGRGWLVSLLETMLGSWNCSRPTIDQLGDKFQDYMIDTLLVSIEEVHQSKGRYELADNLKSILDADKYQGNQKYGAMKERVKYCNFFFMSNRLDALSLEEDDRRLNVFFSRTEKKSEDYYTRLYNLLDNAEFNSQIYTYLTQTVDMNGFNPKGRSMHTEGRQILLRANKSEVDIILTSFIDYLRDKDINMVEQEVISEIIEEFVLQNSLISATALTHKVTELMKSPHSFAEVGGVKKRIWTYKSMIVDVDEEYQKLQMAKKVFLSDDSHPITIVNNLAQKLNPKDTPRAVYTSTSEFDL